MEDLLEDAFQRLYEVHKKAEAVNDATTHAVNIVTHSIKFVYMSVVLILLAVASQIGTIVAVYWCLFHKALDNQELVFLDRFPVICGFIAFAFGQSWTITCVAGFFKYLITFGRDEEDEDRTERYRAYHATDDEVDGIPF